MVTISYDTLNDLSTRARKCNDLEAQVKKLRAERDAAYQQLDCLQSNFDYVSEELGKYDKAPEHKTQTDQVHTKKVWRGEARAAARDCELKRVRAALAEMGPPPPYSAH